MSLRSFTDTDMNRIRGSVRYTEQFTVPVRGPVGHRNSNSTLHALATLVTSLSTTIDAATMSTDVITCGQAQAYFYAITQTSTTVTLTPTSGPEQTIYNMGSDAINGDRPLQCKKIGGLWFVDVESCEVLSS